MECRCIRALLRVEIRVSARKRHTVGFTYRRNDLDLDGEIEIGDHAAEHDRLLCILLAEKEPLRTYDVVELCDHGCNAAEVSGANRALKHRCDRSDVDARG